MPVTFDELLWRTLYSSSVPQTVVNGVVQNPQPPLTYGRAFNDAGSWQTINSRKDWLTGFGLDNNAEILVVGCAFGFLNEYLIDAGIPAVWGIENSPWIWANSSEIRADVLPRIADDWVGSGTERTSLNAVGRTGQARFTFVVDEDAAPAHSDAELPAFIAGCEDRLQGNARGRIVHIVSVLDVVRGPGDSSQNWKTLADWKAVEPAHTWVDRRGNVG